MARVMLQCGHAANATTDDGLTPCCAICAGSGSAWRTVAAAPDLTGRSAVCDTHKHGKATPVASSLTLAFFAHRPTQAHDTYYCGCYGWD